jgi:hypothetical protein
MAELLDISVLNDISAYWVGSEQIKGHVRGIENYIATNKSACLDSAKCLLESICKTVIHENGKEPSSDRIPLNKLFSEAMECLGIVRKEANDIETELFNALVKSIEQIGRYRNHYSANGHGRVADCERLADDVCVMAISTLLSGCLIVFREHKNQSDVHSDVRFSLRSYDAFPEHNDIVDENSLAEIDSEQSEVVFNGAIRFRYSEILFALDREAYADIISSSGDAA